MTTTTLQLPTNPFPGIDPFGYEYAALLYRRDAEKRSLFRQMVMYRGVLVYGDQGVGKSSLVNAGLMPMAIADGYQPHRVRVQPTPGRELVVSPPPPGHGDLDWLSCQGAETGNRKAVAVAPSELLAAAVNYDGERPLLLIFDQFEEWITLFGRSPEKDEDQVRGSQDIVRNTLIALLTRSDLRIKVVLSFREDYLAGLDPIFDKVPNLPDQYVRVLPLSNDQLQDSIVGPFENYPDNYAPPIADKLAATIVADLDKEAPRRRVEAAEVQIVCHELYERRAPRQSYEETYQNLKEAKGILDSYFESKLNSIPRERRDPAVSLLARLILDNHRNVISRDNLLQLVELDERLDRGLLETTLPELEKQGLIKTENRENVEYVEITSEFLIGWIEDQVRKQALTRQAHEFASRQRRWTRRVLTGILLLVPLIALVAFQAGSRSGDAPPIAEIESINIPDFEGLDTRLLFDGDEQIPLVIPAREGRQIKIEVKFADVFDIVDVNVVPDPQGFEPKEVYIASTKIAVPVGSATPVVGRGAYGRTDSITLIVSVQELDPEVKIAELKFWRQELVTP